jgi:hypothetical protein
MRSVSAFFTNACARASAASFAAEARASAASFAAFTNACAAFISSSRASAMVWRPSYFPLDTPLLLRL